MNFEDLKHTIAKDADTYAHTTRFYLADRTLWFKSDDNIFLPMVSFFDELIVVYQASNADSMYPTNYSLPSRTANMFREISRWTVQKWLEKTTLKMSIQVQIHRQFGVERVFPGHTFMLARGIHPEDCHYGRANWEAPVGSDVELPNVTGEDLSRSFECMARMAAWGTISRENQLKEHSKKILQSIDQIHAHHGTLHDNLDPLIDTHFVPPVEDQEKVRRDYTYSSIRAIQALNRDLSLASLQCRTFFEMSSSWEDCHTKKYDSSAIVMDWDHDEKCMIFKASTSYSQGGPFKIMQETCYTASYHDQDFPENMYAPDDVDGEVVTIMVPLNFSDKPESEHEEVPGSRNRRFSIRVLGHTRAHASWYFYKHRFIEVQGAFAKILGTRIPNLFGQTPDQWEYTQIAAPLFLMEKG